jgi:hypothetical protein
MVDDLRSHLLGITSEGRVVDLFSGIGAVAKPLSQSSPSVCTDEVIANLRVDGSTEPAVLVGTGATCTIGFEDGEVRPSLEMACLRPVGFLEG